jgi:diadenosine tetraphosphatase ApaH/serine/threonine PP2A family protein phosphatase
VVVVREQERDVRYRMRSIYIHGNGHVMRPFRSTEVELLFLWEFAETNPSQSPWLCGRRGCFDRWEPSSSSAWSISLSSRSFHRRHYLPNNTSFGGTELNGQKALPDREESLKITFPT